MVRQGNIDNPPKTPLVPGFECSGIVEALGDSVKGYEVMFGLESTDIIKISENAWNNLWRTVIDVLLFGFISNVCIW